MNEKKPWYASKKFLYALAGVAAIALSEQWGIKLSAEQIGGIAVIISTLIYGHAKTDSAYGPALILAEEAKRVTPPAPKS